MLALKDRNQQVMGSVPGLAHLAGVSKEDCHNALTKLLLPDPDSRSKEADGARIKEIDGGWFIINGDKYRNLMSEEDRREYKKLKQRQYRLAVSTESTSGLGGHNKNKNKSTA
jgi:hypothetical protein